MSTSGIDAVNRSKKPGPDANDPLAPPARLRRGRPLEMSSAALIERIRMLANRPAGLWRVHETSPGLYARARRMFGSWAAAVRVAGLDYAEVIERARRRALKVRRMRRRRRPSNSARSGDVLTPQ